MNLHVRYTPSQLKAYQAQQERRARMAQAALKLAQKQIEPSAQPRIINVSAEFKAAQARAKNAALQRQLQQDAGLRSEAQRKAEWRRSWCYMVKLAAAKALRQLQTLQMKELARIADVGSPTITFLEILIQTANKYQISINDIRSARRTRGKAMQARFEVCWRARHETMLSLPQIGLGLGGRDHTTIIHAVRKYDDMRKQVLFGEKAYRCKHSGKFVPELIITESV